MRPLDRVRQVSRSCLLTGLVLAAGLSWTAPAAAVSPFADWRTRVNQALAERAAERAEQARDGETVDVLLVLDDAQEQLQLLSATGGPTDRRRLSRSEYETVVQTRRGLLAALKTDVLNQAAEPDLEVLTDYDNLPILHVRVRSTRAMEGLKRIGRIKSIDPIVATQMMLTQSLPAIQQPAVGSAGYTGAGTTVAVLDTGVDYSRSAFGSCSAPGGSCKVAYAQDFATPDNALDANGHGTNVAGIVLGVAPGARIAALDVFEASGSAYSNVIINAINWCITNRATYNITAINMSLGGGRYYSALAPTDAWGTAIANAVNAGIVVVAASGNNGYTTSLSAPAAYSNVLSVGALYDSSWGAAGWSTCTDSSTHADKVTCFSNSASFLGMVAPGAMITAAGITQGGTSQATPHVAGAVAVLKAQYPSDTVAQTISRLKLGARVVDARNGVSVPRLDLVAALAIPPDTYRLSVSKVGNGSVVSSPAGIDCGATCAADLGTGDTVTLTALHASGAMFAGWSGACTGSSVTCTVTMSAGRSVTANFATNTAEEFLAAGSVPSGWQAASGSSAAWASTTASLYVGTYSLKAGAVGHSQNSAIQTTATFAAGSVSFARRVSSESGKDYLKFYIDGVLQGSWSGEVAWGMVSVPISAGQHTLKWVYEKDGSGAAGSDTAWVDAVNLVRVASNPAAVATDFNGDGRSDIFWRHATNGKNSLWLMEGGLRQSGSGAPGDVTDVNWKIVGSGDFNGDGKADLLFRHAVDGRNSIWFMDGLAKLSATGATSSVTDLNWRVAGVADFDGDGKSDILWRHASNGRNTLWLMDGVTRRAQSADLPSTADAAWRVVGTADFDGDGQADILWRNGTTGANALWLMDGVTRSSAVTVASVTNLSWKVVATGDFDGDGKADILWRHVGNGQNSLWQMNGATRTNSVTTVTSLTDLNWKVAGVGDFDADGKSDILWRHATLGRNAVWFMNGVTRVNALSLIDVTDLNWKLVTPLAQPH